VAIGIGGLVTYKVVKHQRRNRPEGRQRTSGATETPPAPAKKSVIETAVKYAPLLLL